MTIRHDPQKGYASVNGLNLYYEIYGKRRAIDPTSWWLHDR